MSTLAKRCQKHEQIDISSRWHSYSPMDVTTVCDALLHCDDQMLAEAFFQTDEVHNPSRRLIEGNLLDAFKAKLSTMKQVALDMGPNLEMSACEVIIPWDSHQLADLVYESWPNILGRRIALPAALSSSLRHRFLANVLLSMSYI